MNKLNKELKNIIWAALLTAISVLLDVALKLPLPRTIGFAFYAIPIIIAGIFLGIKYSLAIAIIGDTVGVILSGMPFFPIYALGSAMWGLIPPLLLNKYSNFAKIIITVFLTHFIVTTINSIAQVVHYHTGFVGMLIDLPLRIALAIPSSIVIAFLIEALIEPIKIRLDTKLWYNNLEGMMKCTLTLLVLV